MRAFFAIELPGAVRAAAGAAAREAAQRARCLALTRVENLHATLAFLGEIAPESVEPLTRTVARALQGTPPFDLQLGGGGWFPPRGAPRVVWIGALAGNDESVDLATRVASASAEAGCNVDLRPPHAHVTVARARGRVPAHDLAELDAWAGRWAGRPCGEAFEVRRVVLFESTLARGGSVYVERASVELGG